ncbi:MAG TPA: hypothetical protein ENJ20_01155 [Bacteroidetes bacterium]|nr:hypothetical protein [Bacteroidota bacterium]
MRPLCLSPHLLVWLPAGILLAIGCFSADNADTPSVLVSNNKVESDFASYWYNGEGELNTYRLEQSRYGEMRDGEVVMVFVTEPFSKSKQVKPDHPAKNGTDKISVIKLNHIRRFSTGVYDYSMMQSVFTPVDLTTWKKTLKTTVTSQDWCGHTFYQLNYEGGKYKVRGFSYFEKEGDQTTTLKADLLEDELWTRLRINPNHLKEGVYHVIPALFYSRLAHQPLKPRQARLRKVKKENHTELLLEYLHLDRTLIISYLPDFPHKIIAWEEIQDGRPLSRGWLRASIKSAYWQQHDNRHTGLRDSLQMRCR